MCKGLWARVVEFVLDICSKSHLQVGKQEKSHLSLSFSRIVLEGSQDYKDGILLLSVETLALLSHDLSSPALCPGLP